VDVDIYAYGREIETDGDGEVGGFPADSGKFAQLFNRMRQHAVEFLFQNPWQRFEVTGFGAEKSDRMDKAFYLFRFQRFKSFRSSAAGGKKPAYGAGGAGVLGSGAQDGADENLEGVFGLGFDKFNDRGAVFFIFRFKRFIYERYVFDCHADILSQFFRRFNRSVQAAAGRADAGVFRI
jgi:hypothetical protein